MQTTLRRRDGWVGNGKETILNFLATSELIEFTYVVEKYIYARYIVTITLIHVFTNAHLYACEYTCKVNRHKPDLQIFWFPTLNYNSTGLNLIRKNVKIGSLLWRQAMRLDRVHFSYLVNSPYTEWFYSIDRTYGKHSDLF